MITIENFREVIEKLEFDQVQKNVYQKYFKNDLIQVDFGKQEIIYPSSIIVNDRTTSNFSHNENFVVFECVCRLLAKGYRAEHIELEPKWQLGHEEKGGKADILVKDENNNPFIIIECKTFGKEYSKEKNNTRYDGGQLFSYWQQVTSVKWLALYSSDWKDEKIIVESDVIEASDDENLLKIAEKGGEVKIYSNATNKEERYKVWTDTYSQRWLNNVIFDEESQPYRIGIPPLRKNKLKDFSPTDKIVNKFEEILRHNNVSDKENAFNRLIAMFICKLVDETKKGDTDIVDFQYKYGDTYESLQDRLQSLHQQGMEEFMKEKIFYVDDNYAERVFKQYTGSNRKKAIEDLKKTIRVLKFYSNNDFAFKDVHNEELFLQNGKILVEMVQLFQPYRIVYPSKHQFLGDLFEQLLNKGFKQNEGQFFTPTPITRFIWDSLPLENFLSKRHSPKVIDYACGAGHFLTEGVEAINNFQPTQDNSWTEKQIYGIEKDYRLARVSKISLFMNGAGNSNIIFGDGLENYKEKGIIPSEFDILVANPPFSVNGFKNHLKLHNNNLTILDSISEDGSEIEALFVERISQLLKPGGLAAIILPDSILYKSYTSYIKAREQLLQNFRIRAIVQLGGKTFSATSMNTVILFLERYEITPSPSEINKDIVDAIFGLDFDNEFQDKQVLEEYLAEINVQKEIYTKLIKEELTLDYLKEHTYFKEYTSLFLNKSLALPKSLNSTEKDSFILKKLYNFILQIEKEKIYYFSLVRNQKVVIITSPTDLEERQKILGYSWSNRRGNEGIQIFNPGGLLYKDNNRNATGTFASVIRDSFLDIFSPPSPSIRSYCNNYLLSDLLDFSSGKFDKSFTLSISPISENPSKYQLLNLSDFETQIERGTSVTKNSVSEGFYKVVAGGQDFAYTSDKYNRDQNTITISASGAYAGYVNFWKEKIFASDCTTVRGKNLTDTCYIYYYLKSIQDVLYSLQKGAAQPHVYPTDIEKLKIPNAPETIREDIVKECNAIEERRISIKNKINERRQKIKESLKWLDLAIEASDTNYIYKLSDGSKFEIFIGKRLLKKNMNENGNIPVYSANVFKPFGHTNNTFITDFSKDSILWGIDGDWMVNLIKKDREFYPTDHCGVIRIKDENIDPKILSYLLNKEGKRVNFNRSNRASIDRIKSLSITFPAKEDQLIVSKQISTLESEIEKYEKDLQALFNSTNDIINKYLY